ncbi:MAG: YlxR family protein [Candidatus Thermofonsia bacterium]|nr:MAG: YlxR family protein [Candidatus Thermofonsia bacterium]
MAKSKQKPTRQKHIPLRSCVVCREKMDKRLLVRIVRTPEGPIVVDRTGKQNGRGAYLCKKEACWQTAVSKPGILASTLKTELSQGDLDAIWAERPFASDQNSEA